VIGHTHRKGQIIVLSGPSGVGKTTIVEALLPQFPEIVRSISVTTRLPRTGEVDGVDYHFLSKSDFEDLIQRNELVEWTSYSDNYYGTLHSTLESATNAGQDVVLTIDVDGAVQLKELRLSCLLIFVLPPSFRTLEDRLRDRQTDTEAELKQRLERAKAEFDLMKHYDYYVINDQISEVLSNIKQIIEVNRFRIGVDLIQAIEAKISPLMFATRHHDSVSDVTGVDDDTEE